MIEPAYIDVQFKGKNFKPHELAEEINLPIESLVASGDLGKVGRYKGKQVPYGIGLLKILPTGDSIDQYSEVLLKNKSKLRKHNVEEIIIDVDANSEALEKISISGNILKKLSSLNARIQFHNNETLNDDLALLFEKIITKVSLSSHPDTKIINNLFQSFLLQNAEKNKSIAKKSLRKAIKEFDKNE